MAVGPADGFLQHGMQAAAALDMAHHGGLYVVKCDLGADDIGGNHAASLTDLSCAAPSPEQQFVHTINPVLADAREHVAQVGFGYQAVLFGSTGNLVPYNLEAGGRSMVPVRVFKCPKGVLATTDRLRIVAQSD